MHSTAHRARFGGARSAGARSAGLAAATLAAVALGLVPSPASAAPPPALKATLATPPPVAPGGTGLLRYEVTNLSGAPTEGILLNVALPKFVTLPADPHCRRTGSTPEGGTTISCSFTDAVGKPAPGQHRVANTPFSVAGNAPAHARLGRLGALVVPLKNGKPTEDWHNLSGRNTAWAEISTR